MTTILFHSLQRTRKSIRTKFEKNDSKFRLEERDNPRPEFTRAFDELRTIVPFDLGVPVDWADTCRVVGIIFGTHRGARTYQLMGRRPGGGLSKEFVFSTPPRMLEHPTEPGATAEIATPENAAKVWEAEARSLEYIRGERAQGVIEFEAEEDTESEDEEQPNLGIE